MTFELSPECLAARDKARALAQVVRPQAAEIDRTATVPGELSRDAAALASSDSLATVVMVEEIAVASAAVAAALVVGEGRPALGLSGLRGANAPDDSPHTQLALAAMALGVGRAAMEAALDAVRESAATPADVEKPQWLVADVATDLDAARLLAYKAARTQTTADIALARLLASAAAQRAVDAALRVVGAGALAAGSALERQSRDVRVLAVLLGTEENQRAIAADTLLPR
ncbi:MAG TPA: acyl-CoA dehydrogenase family protein [Vicinamibacterales bacterium]|nr:acyl-CoA dehydrogenase family protein [Vicinamibacterales bacterium]